MNNNPARNHHFLTPWIIWTIAASFYGYECFLQISPSVMVPELMSAFKVNAEMLGNLAAFYFYSYTLLQIPSGVLLDRLGPRLLLAISCTICALGALIFSLAHDLHLAQLGRLLIGMGGAFAAIGTFKVAANWFPLNRFALLIGLTVCIGMMGSFGAGAPLAALVEHFGWRESMMILAIIGIVIAALMWLIVRDSPNSSKPIANQAHETEQLSIMSSLKYLVTKGQNWIVAIYGGLVFAPTSAFAGLWGVPFLMSAYQISRPMAGGAVSMIFIGWAVGSPLLGWISDTLKKRKPLLIVGAIGAFITMTAIIYLKMSLPLLYICLFLFGFSSSGFLPAFSIIREINPPNTSATALGFMNTLNMVGGACLQPLIGFFLDLNWDGSYEHPGVRAYNIHDYQIALLIIPIILALSILVLPWIRETYSKPLYNANGNLQKG